MASAERIRQLGQHSSIPLWMPWPLPRGWVVGAAVQSGDEAAGIQAIGVVVSGPNPLGGAGDLLVVAEEQGVGLGAGLAGLPGPDAGSAVDGEPRASVSIQGRLVPLWWVDAHPDRAVYVGQWDGRWLWVVLHPASAGALLLEDLALFDLRDLGHEIDLLPYGTPPPWLRPGYGC